MKPAIFFPFLILAFAAGGCASAPRHDELLQTGWRFHRAEISSAARPGFDDASWERVSIPHTWNAQDGQDGGNNYYRGPAWYRLNLEIPSADKGKELYLRFDAAATVAHVYVNGQLAGTHRGNFAAFCFDVTPLVHPGESNSLAVEVDNSHFDDIPPLSGDFTIFGGLYRNVHLLTLNRLCISPMDDGSAGVYLKQTHVNDAEAQIDATVLLRNTSPDSKHATVICTIRDARGNIVAKSSIDKLVAPGGTDIPAVGRLTIAHPHLWDGIHDPYLYHATIELREGDRIVDQVAEPVGLRYYRVDPDRGLFLNGKHYALHGVGRHQDRLNKGWAISPADEDEDFRLIREMGATGVRLAHYQQSQHVYDLCDRLGLVVWAELPMVNDIAHTLAFADNAKQQLRELIKQNFNHPSILFWSLYNELALRGPEFSDEQKLVTALNKLAHQLDPTRLTAAATHKQQLDHPVNWIPDVTAFNRYWGWYYGQPADWPAGLDHIHAACPGKCVGISEYGAGANIHQHEEHPTKPHAGGAWHPEEWQCVVHEAAWKAMKSRQWLWGTFAWNMFDFASDGRHEGDQPGRNDKGLVTYDRKTKKDAFYFYQANWTRTPMVHINDRRFDPRPSGASEVKVYSNCQDVELTLDGRSLGARSSAGNGVFIWKNVQLHDGINRVRALGTCGGRQVSDEVTWHASGSASTRLSTRPINQVDQ